MMLNARMIGVGVLLAWLGGYAVLRMSWVTYPGLAPERRVVKPDDRPLLMITTGYEWTSTMFRPLLFLDHVLTSSRYVHRSSPVGK